VANVGAGRARDREQRIAEEEARLSDAAELRRRDRLAAQGQAEQVAQTNAARAAAQASCDAQAAAAGGRHVPAVPPGPRGDRVGPHGRHIEQLRRGAGPARLLPGVRPLRLLCWGALKREILRAMMSSKTVFVVGAGASTDFGFPVGNQLKGEIAVLIRPHTEPLWTPDFATGEVKRALALHWQNEGITPEQRDAELRQCLASATDYMRVFRVTPSIDKYIDLWRDNRHTVLLGKIAIAFCILRCERKSKLFTGGLFGHSNGIGSFEKFSETAESWIHKLSLLLGANINPDNIMNYFKNISFITFNYDRCIEQFFHHYVRTYFSRLEPHEAEALLQELKVLHVYGSLSKNPWDISAGGFGSEPNAHRLLEAAQSIRTFTETNNDTAFELEVQNRISEAETLVFLGFAFTEDNISILEATEKHKIKRVFFTSFGQSESEKNHVIEVLKRLYTRSPGAYLETPTIRVCDGKAATLVQDFGREIVEWRS
jgi:hypothetical protein